MPDAADAADDSPPPPLEERIAGRCFGRRDKLARSVGGVFQRFQAGTLSMRCVPFGG